MPGGANARDAILWRAKIVADANVLLPLLTEGHAHSGPANEWWGTCDEGDVGLILPVPVALLRLLTSSRVMGSGTLRPSQAWSAVQCLIDDPRVVLLERMPSVHAKLWFDNVARREPNPTCGRTPGWSHWRRRMTTRWSRSIAAFARSRS